LFGFLVLFLGVVGLVCPYHSQVMITLKDLLCVECVR